MKIELIPQVRDDTLTLSKLGDALTVSGLTFDFNPLPEGATLPADAIGHEFFMWPVKRVDGVLHIKLLFPIAIDASHAACFPEPLLIDSDGPIVLPE